MVLHGIHILPLLPEKLLLVHKQQQSISVFHVFPQWAAWLLGAPSLEELETHPWVNERQLGNLWELPETGRHGSA